MGNESEVQSLMCGRERIEPSDLIALKHYSSKCGTHFPNKAIAYEHFRTVGQVAGIDPSPFFYVRWYAWQNPDASHFDTCLSHFVEESSRRLIDPAPFLDSAAYLAAHRNYPNMIHALKALVDGRDHSISSDIEFHLGELASSQRRVHGAIRMQVIRKAQTRRRRLVWVQAGPRFSSTAWFKPELPRTWDFLCNWYSLKGLDLRYGETHLSQPGTKVTAIHHVLQNAPELLQPYDQVLFLDDDLQISHESIDRFFNIAEAENLDLFQPSLLKGSHGVWPDLFQKSNRGVRLTNGIEIMMPAFSRKALAASAPMFAKSVSGFGLDFEISVHLINSKMRLGVIDEVAVAHAEPIDETGGAFYQFVKSLGINQKLELYRVIRELGQLPEFREIRPD